MAAPAQLSPDPERLYRIGDVSRLTDTKPFVLRFWETEFPMLQPVKAPKGHRLYRQEDIELIRTIKHLLYEEGFTIAGARRHLAEGHAGGAGLGPAREKAPLLVTSGEFAPERTPAEVLLGPPAEVAGARAEEAERIALTADARGALVAVRQELRAILTLLGTR